MTVDLVWEDPPEHAASNTPRHPHAEVTRQLRERPGVWARLPFGHGGLVSAIRNGDLPAWRPAGAFEASSRYGVVWARYIGER